MDAGVGLRAPRGQKATQWPAPEIHTPPRRLGVVSSPGWVKLLEGASNIGSSAPLGVINSGPSIGRLFDIA